MDLNEVRLCGTIATSIDIDAYAAGKDKFNPIKFTLMVGEYPVLCVADDMLAIGIQRRCMRGTRCLVIGRVIARYTANGIPVNGIECIKVIAEGESGYLSEIKEAQERSTNPEAQV